MRADIFIFFAITCPSSVTCTTRTEVELITTCLSNITSFHSRYFLVYCLFRRGATNGLIVGLMRAHLNPTLSAHDCTSVKDKWPITGDQGR
jgi:hypothetical protein